MQHAIRRFGRGGEGDSSAFASFSPVCAIDYEGIGAEEEEEEEEEAGATPRQMTAIPPTFLGLALKDVRRGGKVRKWVGEEDQDSALLLLLLMLLFRKQQGAEEGLSWLIS